MPPAEHATFCTLHLNKMLCPLNCHFTRWPCFHSISRPKSGCVPDKQYGVTVARLHSAKTYLPAKEHPSPVSALSRDQQDILDLFETDSLRVKPFLDDLIVDYGYCFGSEDSTYEQTRFTNRYQPVEEPWLLQPCGSTQSAEHHLTATTDYMNEEKETPESHENLRCNSNSLIQSDHHQVSVSSSSSLCFSGSEHPVEDPWLLYHVPDPLKANAGFVARVASIDQPAQDAQKLLDSQEQQPQASDNLISGGDSNLVSDEGAVSIEILINCSVCTMQRIAVLEDGKLVELLLEPVKSNVLCDSVYLGVVTKLVPHMGGAFVNIGSSRPSLMDIKRYKEPFIFPPFVCDTRENEENDSLCTEKHLETGQMKLEVLEEDDATLSDDDAEGDFEDDDIEELEIDDGMDVEEIQMGNFSTRVVDEGKTDANVGGFDNKTKINGIHTKVQSDFRLSLIQGRKSSKNTRGSADMWSLVRKGTKIVVQVVKEGLGTKGPTLTAYPKLRSRFWVLITRSNSIGVSKKISGVERTRLRVIAKSLQTPGFGVTVRTVAAGHSVEELRKDLEGLLSTWRIITEQAKSAALAADEGVEGAIPVILHQAMGQTLSVVQDYFSKKVKRMIVDSPRTYHEVTNYLQDIAPDLCDRVELHKKKVPLFDEFNIEEEIDNILNKRVGLPNGGSLVIEQTEALVSIDVNGGHGMFGQGASQEKAILDVNLAAAKQIARELRLRDIGGIIVVDFIDMMDDSNKRLVYEEVKKAVEMDRSMVKVSELSKHGLMEITRKRVRPSVTFMISEPCTCCHGTGRVEALETSFSKIEHEICSLLAMMDQKADPENPKSWPRLLLRVDTYMSDYLTSGKKTRLATLSSSLKVWILLKVARSFTRGGYEVKLLADVKASNSHQHASVAMLPSESETPKTSRRTKLFPVKKWRAGRKG